MKILQNSDLDLCLNIKPHPKFFAGGRVELDPGFILGPSLVALIVNSLFRGQGKTKIGEDKLPHDACMYSLYTIEHRFACGKWVTAYLKAHFEQTITHFACRNIPLPELMQDLQAQLKDSCLKFWATFSILSFFSLGQWKADFKERPFLLKGYRKDLVGLGALPAF